jgi:hypothetical protein
VDREHIIPGAATDWATPLLAKISGIEMENYRFGVLGPAGAGKTAWVWRLATGEFAEEHFAARGIMISSHCMRTSNGDLLIHLYDLPGSSKENLPALDACVLVFTRETVGELPQWRRELSAALPGVPVVAAATKQDLWGDATCSFPAVSAKSGRNLEEPLLALVRQLQEDSAQLPIDRRCKTCASPVSVNI